jgi:hypothetical protein
MGRNYGRGIDVPAAHGAGQGGQREPGRHSYHPRTTQGKSQKSGFGISITFADSDLVPDSACQNQSSVERGVLVKSNFQQKIW